MLLATTSCCSECGNSDKPLVSYPFTHPKEKLEIQLSEAMAMGYDHFEAAKNDLKE